LILYNFVLPNGGPVNPKHVGICVLKHYCKYKEVCAFVGHTVINEAGKASMKKLNFNGHLIIMHC
jgi:hypothetical protein